MYQNSTFERWFDNIDHVALLLIIILFFVGLTVQSIAASQLNEVKWLKYSILGIIGLIGMLILSMLSRQRIMFLIPILYIFSIILMITTLLVGIEKNGATRWINIPIMNINFQPIEFYKVCAISVLAIILGWMTEMDKSRWLRINVMFFFIGITIIFGLLQPDLGQMIITILAMLQITLLSVRLNLWILILLLPFMLCGIVTILLTTKHGLYRIQEFLSNTIDNRSQAWFAQNALDRSLLFGRPQGANRWHHLPDVETDYVFILIAEEFGLIIALFLISMLVYLFLRFLYCMWQIEEIKLRLWVWGLVTMYSAQIFVNVATAIRIAPAKGITLPILSYGGSSLLAVFFSLGLLLFITRSDIRENM